MQVDSKLFSYIVLSSGCVMIKPTFSTISVIPRAMHEQQWCQFQVVHFVWIQTKWWFLWHELNWILNDVIPSLISRSFCECFSVGKSARKGTRSKRANMTPCDYNVDDSLADHQGQDTAKLTDERTTRESGEHTEKCRCSEATRKAHQSELSWWAQGLEIRAELVCLCIWAGTCKRDLAPLFF